MNKLEGNIVDLPALHASVPKPASVAGSTGAQTVNLGGKGQNGATFTPSVSEDGVISWTNDRELDNPAPVNIKGPKGDPGEAGPAGKDGAAGPKGDKGDPGPQGIPGEKGDPGKDGVSATHRWSGTTLYVTSASGTSSANLKGDKGDKGDTGPAGADGQPGKDGADGQPGKDGADGKPGADGISPVVSVEDIDGGHRVTITDKDGEKTFDVMDGKDGTGGGGGGLPTIGGAYQQLVTNADGEAVWEDRAYCFVDMPVTSISGDVITDYDSNFGAFLKFVRYATLNVTPNRVSVVFEKYSRYENLIIQETPLGRAAGNLSMLNVALGTSYEDTGEPFLLADIGLDGMYITTNLFAQESHYFYIWFEENTVPTMKIRDRLGLPYSGKGYWAEAFNGNNSATGQYAHAEGYGTFAGGDYAHAEGRLTDAAGVCAHAEGNETVAGGGYSHSEGVGTISSGPCSHAEGSSTIARGEYQHAQGKCNIEDTENKYAHIVGNGTTAEVFDRSNAHTLDWNGLGWFAGGLKVGGTGQDDPNAVAVLTTADMATITQNVIASLPIYNGEVIEQ